MSITPTIDARATELGTAAGAARLAGEVFEPCRWRLGDELPRGRWAALWWQAFADVAGSTLPTPEF